MKASIYIPEDLWRKAQATEGFKLSAFVQEAMRERFDRQRPYRTLDDELVEQKREAAEALLGEMTQAYRAGYQLGLAIAPQLPWEAFVDLEGKGWDVTAWRTEFDESMYRIVDSSSWDIGEEDGEVRYLDFDELMELGRDELGGQPLDIPAYALDDRNVPTGIVGEGFVEALRDVWRAPMAPASHSDDEPDDAEDASDGEDRG